jgi:hypothetical protein
MAMVAEMDTVRISIELPRDAFSTLRQDPEGFARAMRLAAAVKWYENGTLSQYRLEEFPDASDTSSTTEAQTR